MFQNYFVANGQKYYTGAVFIVNNMGKQEEASFICYDTEHKKYAYKIKDCVWYADPENFQKMFVSITNKTNNLTSVPATKTKKDRDIDGMFIGWVWYIFLMGISIIFKDIAGLWILISIIFFSWRAKKIKEEGTYIEW